MALIQITKAIQRAITYNANDVISQKDSSLSITGRTLTLSLKFGTTQNDSIVSGTIKLSHNEIVDLITHALQQHEATITAHEAI